MTTNMTESSNTTIKKGLYTQQRFLFMTLDPVHIGAGGYRLGRVDNTIAREPGTNVPKIPGTSLAGATRSYAAMYYGKPDVAGQQNVFKTRKVQGTTTASCPIIYTFGTATDTSNAGASEQGSTQAGTVSIGDAQILFFPVNSMAGPVWVSTIGRVKEAWGTESISVDTEPGDNLVVTSLNWNKELNLGWLMFSAKQGVTITSPDAPKIYEEWEAIKGRIVLVTEKLFSQIVNSNLEVRTSVSINPETGAAAPGALFTYEAIPRATWLWCDVVEDDYRTNGDGSSKFPETDKQCKVEVAKDKNGNPVKDETGKELKQYIDNAGEPLDKPWKRPLDVVGAGMSLIEYLGVGGMGTRGFGRMRYVVPKDTAMEAQNE